MDRASLPRPRCRAHPRPWSPRQPRLPHPP